MSAEPSIQSQGGKARAKSLTPGRRAEISRRAAEARWGAPRELVIPLAMQQCARVPFPMTDEDFTLLTDTLALWKTKIVAK